MHHILLFWSRYIFGIFLTGQKKSLKLTLSETDDICTPLNRAKNLAAANSQKSKHFPAELFSFPKFSPARLRNRTASCCSNWGAIKEQKAESKKQELQPNLRLHFLSHNGKVLMMMLHCGKKVPYWSSFTWEFFNMFFKSQKNYWT